MVDAAETRPKSSVHPRDAGLRVDTGDADPFEVARNPLRSSSNHTRAHSPLIPQRLDCVLTICRPHPPAIGASGRRPS